MPTRANKISSAILVVCSVLLAGTLGVSAALQDQTDATSDATSDANATSALFALPSPDATSALFAPPSLEATSAPAPILAPAPAAAPLPAPAPSTASVVTVTVADVLAAGYQDAKIQPALGVGQRFDVPDTTYFRLDKTSLNPNSRWVTEGAADIISVFIPTTRGCPPSIVGAPQLIDFEGRFQVRFCHSGATPTYIVVTGPDKTKVIELADIIDKK